MHYWRPKAWKWNFIYAYDDGDDLSGATGLGWENKQNPPSDKQALDQTIPAGECHGYAEKAAKL
eukprot:11832878-Karenia_brevis.AAC.1